jgi:hypothetical protein
MFSRYLLLALLAAMAPAQSIMPAMAVQSAVPVPTPAICPWLTEGGAARAVGGEVSVTVKVSEAGEGSCIFSRSQAPAASLRIEVSKMPLLSCSAGSAKLKGIGNEAMRCKLAGSADPDAEMISGRVRDLHFTITLNTGVKKGPSKSTTTQADALEQIAEGVAGNLF